MKMKKCKDCSNTFEVVPFAKYERKYCTKCSEKRKKMWDDQWKIKFEDCDEE
jgi:uncharacterized paraquat-inducible protein A